MQRVLVLDLIVEIDGANVQIGRATVLLVVLCELPLQGDSEWHVRIIPADKIVHDAGKLRGQNIQIDASCVVEHPEPKLHVVRRLSSSNRTHGADFLFTHILGRDHDGLKLLIANVLVQRLVEKLLTPMQMHVVELWKQRRFLGVVHRRFLPARRPSDGSGFGPGLISIPLPEGGAVVASFDDGHGLPSLEIATTSDFRRCEPPA
ncbi:hypothetical protein D9M68_791140 [compost metagenome]